MATSMNQGDSPHADLARLAKELAALGAESRAERNAKRIVPWIMSIAIHVGLAFLAVFITWTVANREKKDEAVLIVADFDALNYEPVVSTAAVQDVPQAPAVIDFAPPVPPAEELLRDVKSSDADSLASLADLGRTSGAAAALARAAPSGGAHQVSFAGTSATNARKIVYAIDATGTMIAHFQIVIDELARSLANLSPQQSFTVIFFQGENAIEVPPAGKLIRGDAAERERVLKWIRANVVPQGGTNPLVAIEKSLKLKPDVVFMLSHGITGYGKFEIDQRDLLERLDKLNPVDAAAGRRGAQINCIQFIDSDPLDTMKLIAERHGGPNGYKFLSRQELGLGGD